MNRFLLFLCAVACAVGVQAQIGAVRGKVLDKQTNEALQFVNVKVTPAGSDQLVKGGITDATGSFNFTGLQNGSYVLTATFVGYKTATRNFTVSQQKPHITSQLSISVKTRRH